MTQVRANKMCWMGAAGNRFVRGSDETTDDFSLTDSPADQAGYGTSGEAAKRKKRERHENGQKSADMNGG